MECRISDPPADNFIRGIIVILFVGISFILQMSWSIMFIRKWRKSDPIILVRNPLLTLITNLTIFCYIAALGYIEYFLYVTTDVATCYIYAALIPGLIAFIGGPYLLKTFELYFRFSMVEDIFSLRKQAGGGVIDEIFAQKRGSLTMGVERRSVTVNGRTSEIFIPGRLGWFLRYREKFLTWKFQLLFEIIWAGIAYIPSILSNFEFTFSKYIGDGVILLILIITLAILFWKLKGQTDAWGIKRELRNVMIYAFIAGGLRFTVFLLPLDSDERKNIGKQEIIAFLVFTILLQFMAFESVGRPCMTKLKVNNRLHAPSSTPAVNSATGEKLLQLLKFPDFVKDFHEYLKKELSAENLNFIEAVLQYEKDLRLAKEEVKISPEKYKENISHLLREVSRIIRVYVDNRGAIPVNLSGIIRAGTLSRLTEVKKIARETRDLKAVTDEQKELILSKLSTILEDAKIEILQLLQSDPLNRFMKTEEYLRFEQMNLSWDIVVRKKSPSAIAANLAASHFAFSADPSAGKESAPEIETSRTSGYLPPGRV